jgi:thiamine-monophosphate kinase
VTGALGGPARAVRAWEAGEGPTPWSRHRFARPAPRIAEARWLAEQEAHAIIDISDGLSSELRHLAHASKVEIHVDLERVPVGDGLTWKDAVAGGEEYELVVAVPHELDVNVFARTFGLPLTQIGRVRASALPGVVAHLEGARVDLTYGYDHFSR